MNSPSPAGSDDLRYAEYVLGVLDADARAAVAEEARHDPAAAAAIALWQRHLLPLGEDVVPVAPGDYVWARISGALGFASTPTATTGTTARPDRWWNSLTAWRWIGTGAMLAAAASLALWFVGPRAPTTVPAVHAPGYLVASIDRDDGVAAWTVTLDPARASLVIVPASPGTYPADRSTELWLLPAGGAPISLGVFTANHPTTVKLAPELVARLNASAALAVSLEPLGGSPTGAPTGAVVAKGAISGA